LRRGVIEKMTQQIDKTITIKAPSPDVWDALINPDRIKQWMEEPGMGIEIITEWKVGSPIVIRGFHHIKFENKGTVLRFEPEKALQYNYLSSLSRLSDKPENYTTIEFKLTPSKYETTVTLNISNFPTERIF
jgi:uncharacterized protein YndB with AHSA1/START domain